MGLRFLCIEEGAFHFALCTFRLRGAGREDGLEGLLPGGEGLLEANLIAVALKDGLCGDFANLCAMERELVGVLNLYDNPAVVLGR